MSDEAQRWKEKYLHALEQHEQLEERWRAHVDLLRRSLVRSSYAADGADPAVEHCMRELRELLRDDVPDDRLSALVPRLERAVLATEKSRKERLERLTRSLHRFVAQLQALPLPSEVRKPLKKFSRQLDERAAQPLEWPDLLAELGELQDRALTLQMAGTGKSTGLLSKLFGQREHSVDAASEESATSLSATLAETATDGARAEGEWQTMVEQPRLVVAGSGELADGQCVEAGTASVTFAGEAMGSHILPVSPEHAYSVIAERVEAALYHLLDGLQLPEHQQPKVLALRERIERGLNWYELVPLLDDLAQLMVAAADHGQSEFESYLKLLNERLAAMHESLCVTHQGHAQSQETAQALNEALRHQFDGLQSSMRDVTDLPGLKQIVQARIDRLLETVDSYEQQRSAHELQVSERLNTLVGRVASLEQSAAGMREHLEEQRQKALRDPLTELPNRAGWDERLTQEVARQQRYGDQLLLAVLDVDYFKQINDRFGHLAGDRVLKIIASELHKRLRKSDFIARFGGEEFALLLPETPLAAGMQLLESLRLGIQDCPFHFKGTRIQVTLSGGLASFADTDSAAQVFERADQALYRAKGAGRNRIEAG
ncbi:diguanylate cyclase [Pseudomonas sp. SST3]|uniref:diguanylate cyclase n=1 Tax=Pseudomonas sp. SST3 TaxID=2267882 RepID=UPI000DF9D88D|nr:diguanylate cyclase [Pseudomonas sp. SST3]NKQ09614.1 GGDEF domain-containing protein [Pseudomonas sp. SST3]